MNFLFFIAFFSIFLVFLVPVVFVCIAVVLGKSGKERRGASEEELRMAQMIHANLDKIEKRVERLEITLMDKYRHTIPKEESTGSQY